MSRQVKTLTDLFSLILENPSLAKRLKSDPVGVAEMFGITLSDEDAKKISEKLDVNAVSKFATEVDAMSAKVAQGVGIMRSTKAA